MSNTFATLLNVLTVQTFCKLVICNFENISSIDGRLDRSSKIIRCDRPTLNLILQSENHYSYNVPSR